MWYNVSVPVSKNKVPQACYLGSSRCESLEVLARSHGKEECSYDEVDFVVVGCIGHDFSTDESIHTSE